MKYLNIFIGLALLFFITSCCDDFLNETSPDQLTTGNFWRDQADAEAGLAAVYAQLESSDSYWSGFQEGRQVMKQYRSDFIYPGADAFNYASWTDIYNFTYTFGNANIYQIWAPNYRGIQYANQVIAKVGEMSDDIIDSEIKGNIIGEAKFLRAYYHFELLQYFEDIVLRMEMVNAENLEKATSTRTEVYDAIVGDLSDAIKTMVDQHDDLNKGRATSYTAMAYLGKVNLYRAAEEPENAQTYYQNAINAFKPIIDDGKYSLVDNYLSQWDGTTSNTSESLFEFQMSPSEDNGAYYKFVLYYFYGAGSFGGWEEILGTDALLAEMQKEGQIATDGNYDSRLYWNCYFNDPYYNDDANPMVFGDTYINWFGADNSNVYLRKFLPPSADVFNTWGYAQNVPLMRYADVLLMYAEALNEANQTSLAIPLINEVRERANMPALTINNQSDVREQIKHERVMELTLEGVRFFDLRRWGDLENAMTAAGRTNFNKSEHSYLPIPELEVISNSKID